jgi:hypothetical protein
MDARKSKGAFNVKMPEKKKNLLSRRFIFLTAEGRSTAPNNEDVENLQVLGFACGNDLDSAKRIFFEENDWILTLGFSESEIQAFELANHSEAEAISVEMEE